MPKTLTKLVLFDIDGTLVTMRRGMPQVIFRRCMNDLFGLDVDLTNFEFSGRTDTAIFREIGSRAGLSTEVIEANQSRVMEHIGLALAETMDTDSLQLLPGIHALLASLHAREDIVLAILTGNTPRGAEVKLRVHGLDQYFRFGVYGTESHDRNELGPIALQRASELLNGAMFSGSDVVIVGDTTRDAACAEAIGARCLITLTGNSKREEFIEHVPEYFFTDLSDIEAVTSAIFSEELV